MSFRIRLLAALALAAVVPLAVFALGARREAADRLGTESRRRARDRAETVRSDLRRETSSIRRRLAAAAGRARRDPRLRRALAGGGADRGYLLDWAGPAMRAAGLDALQLLDPDGRIVSSGHFRTEWGRRAPGLGPALSDPGAPVLARLRRPEGPFPVLAAAVPLEVGGRTFRLVGGLSMRERLLPRMDRGGGSSLSLTLEAAGDGPEGAGSGAEPASADGAAASVRLPLLVPGEDGVDRRRATLEVRSAGLALAGLRRGLDRWFLLTVAAALLAAFLTALWLAGRMSRPLEELAARTRSLDLERLDVDFPVERSDEIGDLARTLEELADRLRRGTARLRAAERQAALGDLARQVNHDVRNALAPLRNVLAHLEEAVRETGGEAERVLEERGATLEAGLAYLEELAGRYRDLSSRPRSRPCDASRAVRSATAGLADGDRLRVEVEPDLPPVRAEPVALRRILENLARNALEAAGADGTVRVRAGTEHGGDGGRDDRVRVEVEDDGPGMTGEEIDRAFEAFHTTRKEGTGLGLSIVRRLVHDLDGELEVESEPGRGSRFTVWLAPAEDGVEEAPGGAGPAAGSDGEEARRGRRG